MNWVDARAALTDALGMWYGGAHGAISTPGDDGDTGLMGTGCSPSSFMSSWTSTSACRLPSMLPGTAGNTSPRQFRGPVVSEPVCELKGQLFPSHSTLTLLVTR